jgi:hypothetical protein
MNKKSPNIMVLWHASPDVFVPPYLHENQWTGILEQFSNCVDSNSKYFTIPNGEFDLLSILEKKSIPKPDFLFICLDATTSFFARNIKSVTQNSFLCLGDTHHLPNPISRLANYVANEEFAGHIFTNNIRHAHWFKNFSKAEQFFEPGFFTQDMPTLYEKNLNAKNIPVFFGQMGRFHPRRIRLLTPLLEKNLINHVSGKMSEITKSIQNSVACINVTLNSDLNSRIFEIAQTGCLQIIDELSTKNGHGSILVPNHNCLTFQSAQELMDICNDSNYLIKICEKLGNNLKHEFHSKWSNDCIRDRFNQTLLGESIRFNTTNIFSYQSQNNVSIKSRLHVYENLLEIHRCNELIDVHIDSVHAQSYSTDMSDLPRISTITREELMTPSDAYKVLIKDDEAGLPQLFNIKDSDTANNI